MSCCIGLQQAIGTSGQLRTFERQTGIGPSASLERLAPSGDSSRRFSDVRGERKTNHRNDSVPPTFQSFASCADFARRLNRRVRRVFVLAGDSVQVVFQGTALRSLRYQHFQVLHSAQGCCSAWLTCRQDARQVERKIVSPRNANTQRHREKGPAGSLRELTDVFRAGPALSSLRFVSRARSRKRAWVVGRIRKPRNDHRWRPF